MYLCYIDESGNTGNNLKDRDQPLLVLTALLVAPDNVKNIEDDIKMLGYRHFAAESLNTDFEFHGDGIYNARGRYFRNLPLARRLTVLDELVQLAISHAHIHIGHVCIDKMKYFGRQHIQQAAFSLLVERLEELLKGRLNSYGLLIADEQDELEQKLIDDLDHFKQTGTHFGYKNIQVDRIIDSVHFVQSKNNYLMQLTDVLCYIIRKGKEGGIKLGAEFRKYHAGNPNTLFSDWLDVHGHKGHRYFYNSYRGLSASKSWIFSKDFPA